MISLYHSEFCRIRRASGSFRVKPGTRKSSACYGTPRGSLLYMYDDSFFAPAASAVRLGSDLPPPCPAASHQPAVLCKGSMAAPVSVNAVVDIILPLRRTCKQFLFSFCPQFLRFFCESLRIFTGLQFFRGSSALPGPRGQYQHQRIYLQPSQKH